MKALSIVIAAVLLASPAFARIGETEEQIRARYGKLITASPNAMGGQEILVFRAGGMRVGVTFINGKSAAEFFSKEDDSDLSGNEIEVILAANSEGGKWSKSSTTPFGPIGWMLEGTDRTAGHISKSLMIFTGDFLKKSAELTAKEAKEKLKNF